MSEPKENEPGEGALADEAAAAEADEKPEAVSEEATEAEASAEPVEKKKKKKARDTGEPETIKDRNERVRAEAAEKRRARREREQATAPRRNLDASEMVEDGLARSTHAAATFLRNHFNKVQWAIMAGLVAWIAWEVYSWRHSRQAEKATDVLFKALSAEMGKVGAGTEGAAADPSDDIGDARRSFKDDAERLNAAKKEYVLASAAAGPAASVLADLGAAGVAYDLGQFKDAQAAFEKVKQHPAFGTDGDIRGRTLEGLGMALEAQKNEEGALKAFRELASMDTANFSALGMYHQARLLKGQGKNEEAVKLLDKAGDKLVLLKDTPAAIKYLRVSILELYESLDSKKSRELQQKLMPADILKQLQEKMGAVNAAKAGLPAGALPPMPAMPVPAPEELPAPSDADQPPAPTPGPLRDEPTPEAPAPAPSGAP